MSNGYLNNISLDVPSFISRLRVEFLKNNFIKHLRPASLCHCVIFIIHVMSLFVSFKGSVIIIRRDERDACCINLAARIIII